MTYLEDRELEEAEREATLPTEPGPAREHKISFHNAFNQAVVLNLVKAI